MNTPDGIVIALTRREAQAILWHAVHMKEYTSAVHKLRASLQGPPSKAA